ncbi:MBL fold metallo-hydrolase [Porphyromonas gingivalis]|uniref:MBL fold metallo-hydrolase n=1 Tax=Porphyromonas gingivalis TaxID=837 RepID=UPI0003AD0BD6|nr:MBL fold metallo-hydrolase [Porphyromonas gingivalis]ERJ88900.1 metallo-beta-lactamase domain protein [Porphyromonas gingivalis F0566]MCE8175547.1 MBL fold metallo-hydrolase [Porphyromonas gingivalis]
MIERIFYPVGQGAFYVEKHGDKNIVYDCGSSTFDEAKESDKKKKRIIADAFSKEEEIDILFISHFHEDHVNMIPFLKDRVHIKRVVMPLLDPKEEAFLSFIYGDGDKDNYLVELIRNPEGFFGKGTLITHVDSYKEGDDVDIPFEEVPTEMLKSGTPIPFSNGCGFDWIFVPYNFKHEERRELFKEKLKKELTNKEYDDSLKILEEDPNLDLFFQHKKSGLTVLGKKVKSIYEKMPGKDPINENSMLLYSGPISEKHRYSFHCFSGKISLSQNRFCFNFDFNFYLSFYFYRDVKRVGSIYTGDANLKDDEMLRAFKASMKSFGDRVGTMQIPHHGSFKNYSKEIFDIFKRPLVCPISFGKENRYRHPSTRIIIDILRNNSFPVLVTEDIDTLCVELIDYYPFG